MNDEINYENNPLNGVGLKQLLTEIVDHYGFEILYAYLNINCFKTNPSIISSIKFLKKTDWAREKVEAFYLYQFKNLPKVSSEQFTVPARDRIVPDHQKPGEPAELSLEDAELQSEKRAKKSAIYDQGTNQRPNSGKNYGAQRGRSSNNRDNNRPRTRTNRSSDSSSTDTNGDPWGKWKK